MNPFLRRVRTHTVPTEAINGEPRNGPRCPDCGRYWRREEVEDAYRHVREGCQEKAWAGLR